MQNPRKERILRLLKRLERLTNNLRRDSTLADLSQFLAVEKEIQIQTAYLQHEGN